MKNASAASKPRSKKNSDAGEEQRSEKKKKNKSNKRRRDPSLCTYSSDSDSDDGHRARRKRAKKSEKRKREPKSPDKKKKKKKRSRKSRYRSASSSRSYSSRSCSTCRGRSSSTGRSVSMSPPPKGRSTGRGGRDRGAERGRSQQRRMTSSYQSRSPSTCGWSRSRSPSGRGASRARSCSREKHGEIEQPRRLRSVLAVAEEREVEVGIDDTNYRRDRIIQAYDDFNRYDLRRKSDSYGEAPERNASQVSMEDAASAWFEDGEVILNKSDKQPLGIADVGGDDFTWKKSDNCGGSESVDLESQLRQRALENFKKFRRSLSATRSEGDQENESSQTLCREDAVRVAVSQDAIKSLDGKFASSFEHQANVQGEIWLAEPRVRSVVNIPAEKDTSGHIKSHQNPSEGYKKVNKPVPDNPSRGQSNANQVKWIEEPSNKKSLQHPSLIKDKLEKRAAAEPGSSTDHDAEANQADRQPTLGLPAHHKMESGNEKKEEDAGSEFQQKTFSRMHDGELVQVSYKVYIPKKSPALARRQLQQ